MADFASSGDLEVYLGKPVDAARAEMLLEAATALVRSYVGWDIAPRQPAAEFTVNGSGGTVQPLPTRKLNAVTTVAEDGADLDPTAYDFSEAGYLYRSTPWTAKLRGIVATVDSGYDETPPEVKAVVLSSVARAYASPSGVIREQTGPFAVTYSSTGAAGAGPAAGGVVLLDLESGILDRYVIP